MTALRRARSRAGTEGLNLMHYVVAEEVWSIPSGTYEAKLVRVIKSIVGGDKFSATESAWKLASKFDHHNFEENAEEHPYWWGRNNHATEYHRFVIRPAN
jgi:hypothetical protein